MKLQRLSFSLILSLMLIIGLVPFTAFASANISVNAVTTPIHPGDLVTVSGTSTFSEVIVKVVGPDNRVVFFDIAKVNTTSQFSTSFTLGASEAAGTYKIVAGQGNDVDSKDLLVEAKAIDTETGCTSNCGGGGIITGTITPPTNGILTLPAGKSGEVSLNNEVTVTIPTGATGKELKLTIEKVLNFQALLTNKEVLASPIFEILKNFSESFSKPVTLTFAFDPAKLSGDQRAAVFYYDEAKKVWVEVTGGKVTGAKISVEVNHFTKYAVMIVGQETTVPANPNINFSDISGHWAEASIKQAVYGGIVKGYPDGTFKPGKTVTRAEFAVMLMNALKPQGEGAELTFTDKAKIGTWAQKAVAQAVQAGIIKGYQDGRFGPNDVITRAQMAVMLANASGQSIDASAATGFADDKSIPTWAKASVAYVKQAGIVQGKSNNKFAPQDPATRAEAVTVLLKMLEQQSK